MVLGCTDYWYVASRKAAIRVTVCSACSKPGPSRSATSLSIVATIESAWAGNRGPDYIRATALHSFIWAPDESCVQGVVVPGMYSPNSDIAYAALVCGSMLFLSKLSMQLGRIILVRGAAVIIAVINHNRVDTTQLVCSSM